MIDINCAAIPEERLESELFGHEKGAVSWSDTRKRGRFEMANSGTLFLDEIGDLSLQTQAKLLRVLQEQTFQRVGGGRDIRVDVRIIAASNKDLKAEIERGSFREDLYHRLNEIPIHVPPLRHRTDDIPVLLGIFLEDSGKKNGICPTEIDPDAMALLLSYDWPGNVRELKNLIGRLMIILNKPVIEAADIPFPYNPVAGQRGRSQEELFAIDDLSTAKALFEAEFIRRKFSRHGNNLTKTASVLGVDPAELRLKLEASGVSV
jgi:two-component system nitrogen regulation response regulator NtrX